SASSGRHRRDGHRVEQRGGGERDAGRCSREQLRSTITERAATRPYPRCLRVSELENESGSGVIGTARLEAFSDGVLAIVITLLVLDLRAPTTRGSMLHELVHQWPIYISYLASFAYVGVIWVSHHQLFTRIDSVDTGLLWRNLALLLPTSVLPFPTAVLGKAFQSGSHADQRMGV